LPLATLESDDICTGGISSFTTLIFLITSDCVIKDPEAYIVRAKLSREEGAAGPIRVMCSSAGAAGSGRKFRV
jgi:hypothetical protein